MKDFSERFGHNLGFIFICFLIMIILDIQKVFVSFNKTYNSSAIHIAMYVWTAVLYEPQIEKHCFQNSV